MYGTLGIPVCLGSFLILPFSKFVRNIQKNNMLTFIYIKNVIYIMMGILYHLLFSNNENVVN